MGGWRRAEAEHYTLRASKTVFPVLLIDHLVNRWSQSLETLKLDIPFTGSKQEGPSVLLKVALNGDSSFDNILRCYIPDSELLMWVKWSNKKAKIIKNMDRPDWCPEHRSWPP